MKAHNVFREAKLNSDGEIHRNMFFMIRIRQIRRVAKLSIVNTDLN